MRTNLKTLSIDLRKSLFWTLATVSALSFGIYFYAILATVNHTIVRKNLMNQSATLQASVSELEFKDIALRNRVNLELALTKGFREVRNPVYVARTNTALTLNTEGISEAR